MTNIIRIKRRASGGGSGSPTSLENAEMAYNEETNILYYGTGTGGAGGTATAIIPIAGVGAYVDVSSDQAIDGEKTFTQTIIGSIDGNAGSATALETAHTISITGDITYTSDAFDGTGDVTGTGTLATVNDNVGDFTKVTVNGKGLVTAASAAVLADLGTTTADFSMNTYKITNLGDPSAAQDAATKNYVDSVAQGLDVKASVVAGTTANITLIGTQTIDGISLSVGDRALVKNQTLSQDNGIYIVDSGAWLRSPDADTWAELVGAFTFIETGTQGSTGWVCTVPAGGILGVTAVTWTQFSGAGSYTAGTGLTLTGNEFSITDTAVAADSYGNSNGQQTVTFSVNAQGQLTAAQTYDINVDGGTY